MPPKYKAYRMRIEAKIKVNCKAILSLKSKTQNGNVYIWCERTTHQLSDS